MESGGAERALSSRHVDALDGLRAIAVLSVIAFHARVGMASETTADRVYEHIASAGWIGVDLFFVLSGFLITGILLDSKGRPRFFRNFYVRRTLRIFPLYYAVLLGVLVVAPLFLSTDDPGVRRILHLQGWLWAYGTNLELVRDGGTTFHAGWMQLTHLWSLAVEEQFYLVWPMVVFLLPRRGLVIAACAVVIAAPILRAAMLAHGSSVDAVYFFTPTRLDALAVGALLAVLVRSAPASVPAVARALLVVGGAGLAAVVAKAHELDLDNPIVQRFGYTALELFCGGVVLAAAHGGGAIARAMARPALVRIGRYSYGIYLFHAILLPALARLYDYDDVAPLVHSRLIAALGFTLLVAVVTVAVAAASWHLFERRFLALKDRWAPSLSRGTAAAGRASQAA